MLLEELRNELIKYGLEAYNSGLTMGTGGNLSACDRESGLMAITPSGIPYAQIRPEDVVLIDIQTGEIKDSKAIPSTERDMHRIFYKYRTDINALVHVHSSYATTYSCFRRSLPAISYLTALAGSYVPCAKYATFGTVKLAKNAFKAMDGFKAVLLANHGQLAGGDTVKAAYELAENVEFACGMYCTTIAMAWQFGSPKTLSAAEMSRVADRLKGYGNTLEDHEDI